MNIDTLNLVIQGQSERSILAKSKYTYIAKCRVMARLFDKCDHIRESALEMDNDGKPLQYSGKAAGLYKFKLPITCENARLLFAMISMDDTLPRKRGKRAMAIHNIADDEDIDDADIALDPGRNLMTVTPQTYQNYKSALKWWHEFSCVAMDKIASPWPEDVDSAINRAIASYKRDIGVKKRRGIMTQKEGKRPYNLLGYITICKYFAKMAPSGRKYTWHEGLFAGLFQKLSVNTIGRSDNIDDLLLSNMDWNNDAMVLCFASTKSDQNGEKTSDVKRLYANPFKPELCVILQLAVYTWCKSRTSPSETIHLFDGLNQNNRYYAILMEALKDIPQEIDLGCSRSDIGTHSNRKFAESTSASKIDGPSSVQVCLRAGQGVGRTQDCYMYSEPDGDALVGRTVAQLKLDADEFDVIAPHFGTETLQELHTYGWNLILDGYNHYPQSFQRVIPFLLASLVYHYYKGHLHQILHIHHPLFSQRIFTNTALIKMLEKKVILVHAYCNDTHISAEGVPGIILISREIREFRLKYNETCNVYIQRIEELNSNMKDMYDDLPQKIVNMMLERFQINGVIPVSLTDIRALISEMMMSTSGPYGQILEKLNEISSNQTTSTLCTSSSTTISARESTLSESVGIVYYWRGYDDKVHTVPYGFKFPSYNVSTMWNLWIFGDSVRKICPYHQISSEHDLVEKVCKTNRSRTKKVINYMIM
jgi:hypothetical protein